MNVMKRISAIIFSALIALSFAGCQNGGSDNKADSEGSVSASSPESSAQSAGDNSASETQFDLTEFKSDEITDIEKVDIFYTDSATTEGINNACATYEFYFTCDDYQIKAFVCIPAEVSPENPGKCLMYNRGGHWNYGSVVPENLAYMCYKTGRVVVSCEIRGGNGSEGFDGFGGDEMHDVFKLIDLCDKEFSFVNMDDFSVVGVSRGGMTTYMAAKEDMRVKKIVVAGGISDLAACYNDRDDLKEMIGSCIGAAPDEKPEEYQKRSAVCWPEKLTVPVLIIHSKGDKMVNYEHNAVALYEKIKDTTDCTLITNEGDYHGINPAADSQDIPEIIKFLNK